MELLHELVTAYAAQNPAKAAVTDESGELSYGALESRSAAAARALAARGFRAGDAAAVYVPYCKEILPGMLSVLRAGGVYIPFDDAYPVERMDYMLGDSGAKAVLTVRELWERKPLDFPAEKVVFLDELAASDEGFASPKTLSPDSPAMLLYTSGTTGRPKGVLHTHKLLVNLLDWMDVREGAEVDENTRSGVMSGFTFVATQVFLVSPLTRGGTVCIAPQAARKDMGYLHQFIRETGITHIFLPSSLGAVLAEDYDIRGVYVLVGGEKLRNFRPFIEGNCLIHGYGCTETAVLMAKKARGDEERLLIGKPAEGTAARIVDESFRTVEAGETGELLISSPFMSRQYYGLPELSAEKWVELDGKLWYRTGDRAKCSPEGDYDILGRTDNMVKLRGFRIETGEVEVQTANAAARLGRSDVGQIAVVLKTVGGTERLCCYYEAKRELDKKAVTEEIAKYLAEYMVPDVWVRMDALPRNANGKVMRAELPQPKREREDRIAGALDSEVLARLVYTAADVLDTEELIGPDDRFTDLGGTSLTAMKYTALLREQGIKISAAEVLRLNALRRIADAAEVVYEQLWSQKEREEVRRDFASRGERIEKVLPISPAQDEMLFEQILHPDWAGFKNVFCMQLDSLVPEQALREALDVVAGENEELRAAMVFHHVTVVQQVITDRRIPLEMIEAETFGDREMAALKSRLLHTPMDLQQSSLMKAACVHAGGESFLFVTTHRIAFEKARLRGYLARLMAVLQESCPNDTSIRDWRAVFETVPPADGGGKTAAERAKELAVGREVPPEICVYSENTGPKVVFVHTANTGSAAYYRLADRIGGQVSFAVIEPFNLYHMDEARHGISGIAEKYIEILKRYQPEGPYILGGWCYGGVVAHEMACRLEQAGEEVRRLIMLDSHAADDETLRGMAESMYAGINREYFETSPLFADLRESGMLEAMIANAAHVTEDLMNHTPSFYHGNVTYFKPRQVPAGVTGEALKYWERMMAFEAGNYENYCSREKLRIIDTPHEHDLMMDDPSLDVIVPELLRDIGHGA